MRARFWTDAAFERAAFLAVVRRRIQAAIALTLVLLFGPLFIVSARASGLPQGFGSEAQSWLRATVANGRLPELRWPDFSDYSKHLQKFYELNGYSSWWTKDNEPTPQARQLIALFQQADQKGLSPVDYDGPRWSDRLAALKPVQDRPAEADFLKLELALSVCAMRYISDLHIGKVNPKRLAFAIDDESKKYDLAEFLKDRVVAASDVAAALAEVEPQYPGYRRTVQALQRYIELAKQDDGELLPPVKKAINPGDPYPGVPRLARLLRLVGDLPADASIRADQVKYEGDLVSAVTNFQRRLWPRAERTNCYSDGGGFERPIEPARSTDATHARTMAVAAERVPSGSHRGKYSRVPPSRLRPRLQHRLDDESGRRQGP